MSDNEDYDDTRERIEKNTMVFPSLTKAGSVAISKGGMTLRQYYSGQFAAATIANPDYLEVVTQRHGGQPEKMVARVAVEYADALIAELEK